MSRNGMVAASTSTQDTKESLLEDVCAMIKRGSHTGLTLIALMSSEDALRSGTDVTQLVRTCLLKHHTAPEGFVSDMGSVPKRDEVGLLLRRVEKFFVTPPEALKLVDVESQTALDLLADKSTQTPSPRGTK